MGPMNDYAIQAHGLSKNFDQVQAVVDLELEIPRAEIFGFLGPNGSGKTTAIRMLCGLLTPSAGHIHVLGHEIPKQAEALRLKVGYMTQNFSLYGDLSVWENLAFIADIYSLGRAARKTVIQDSIERYALGHLVRQRVASLSGGQKQRLALAAATLHKPELLLLDEPTSAVDPENRRAFWESLFDLVQEQTTILVSTHYMDEAERCHGLAILDRGRLVAAGRPAELAQQIDADVFLLESPQPRRLKQLINELPLVHSVAQIGNTLRVMTERASADAAGQFKSTASGAGLTLSRCEPGTANLEDVFVAATRNKQVLQ